MSKLIEVNGVSYEYQGEKQRVTALSDISFDIHKGEFVCVLGPSGCGKTTLLNILAGYLEASAGEVLLTGKSLTGPSKDVGVVFQSATLYPWLSVRENVEFGPRLGKIAKKIRDTRVDKLLESVGLSQFADSKTFELSGGMRQRASLARVLANNPEVILMDEPFGALDALTRLKMQRLIRSIWHESKRTVFLITHDIDEALSLATKIIVMTKLPGQIDKVIDVSYTFDAINDEKGRVHADQHYLDLKEQVLDLIEN